METILTVRQADYKLPKLGSTHYYFTRHCNQLAATKINLKFSRENLLVAEIRLYNSLSEIIQSDILFLKFKKS